MKKHLQALVLLPWIMLFAGCASQSEWARFEICFGRSADAGQTRISDRQWQQFRDQEIIGRFGEGFTMYAANGYWRKGTETYMEPSEIMMVVAPDTRDTQDKLDAIARAYALKFRQDTVLQIKSRADVIFHRAARPTLDGASRNEAGKQ